MIPVAKRNFSKRHAHGLLESPPQYPPPAEHEEGEEEEEEDDGSTRSKRQRRRTMERRGTLESWGEALKLLLQDDVMDDADEPGVPKTIVVDASSPPVMEEVTAQERQWLALFRHRPVSGATDEKDIRLWMSAILETAGLKTLPPNSQEDSMSEGRDARGKSIVTHFPAYKTPLT